MKESIENGKVLPDLRAGRMEFPDGRSTLKSRLDTEGKGKDQISCKRKFKKPRISFGGKEPFHFTLFVTEEIETIGYCDLPT